MKIGNTVKRSMAFHQALFDRTWLLFSRYTSTLGHQPPTLCSLVWYLPSLILANTILVFVVIPGLMVGLTYGVLGFLGEGFGIGTLCEALDIIMGAIKFAFSEVLHLQIIYYVLILVFLMAAAIGWALPTIALLAVVIFLLGLIYTKLEDLYYRWKDTASYSYPREPSKIWLVLQALAGKACVKLDWR